MILRPDEQGRRYVGERLIISATAFNAARRDLQEAGMSIEDAVTTLLEEEGWSAELPGVELLESERRAPTLWYDLQQHRFVGTRLSVDAHEFYARVRRMSKRGRTWSEALTELRREACWTLDMAGVEPACPPASSVPAGDRTAHQADS